MAEKQVNKQLKGQFDEKKYLIRSDGKANKPSLMVPV